MHRILRNAIVTGLVIAGFYGLVWLYDTALRDGRFLDGWILAAGCLVQLAFSIRRKLPLLPLGRVASWMLTHLYTGYFLIAAFALHTQFEWPDGVLETALWAVFFVLAFSGVVGAYLSRTMPSQMPATGAYNQLEDIYSAQFALARRADDLALSTGGTASVSIAELYANTLHGFFNAQRNALGAPVLAKPRIVRRVYAEIDGVDAHVDLGGQKTLTLHPPARRGKRSVGQPVCPAACAQGVAVHSHSGDLRDAGAFRLPHCGRLCLQPPGHRKHNAEQVLELLQINLELRSSTIPATYCMRRAVGRSYHVATPSMQQFGPVRAVRTSSNGLVDREESALWLEAVGVSRNKNGYAVTSRTGRPCRMGPDRRGRCQGAFRVRACEQEWQMAVPQTQCFSGRIVRRGAKLRRVTC